MIYNKVRDLLYGLKTWFKAEVYWYSLWFMIKTNNYTYVLLSV